jgi:hypothetical protein
MAFIEKGRIDMVNYEALYKALFNGLTDAIWALEREDYGSARLTLIKAQQEAEELFISDEEFDLLPPPEESAG